jgi:hypothetical protein
MGLVGAFTISMVFVNAFECDNPSDAWSAEILLQGAGSCNDLHPVYFGQAGFNIASDLMILILPMPILSTLQMKRQKRVAIIGVFSVGAVAVLASIIRIYALYLWSTTDDVPYQGATILIWSQIEINAAITSASFPALKPLFSFLTTGLTTANTDGYVRYGDHRSNRSYGTSGLSAHDNRKSHIALNSRPYHGDTDFDDVETGTGVALTTLAPHALSAPPPAYSPAHGTHLRSEAASTNSSGAGTPRWNKSGLGPRSEDSSSDERMLTRYSEDSQNADGGETVHRINRNMVITRKVSVEMRSDIMERHGQEDGYTHSSIRGGWNR